MGISRENIEREAEGVSSIVKRENISELIQIIITSCEIILDCAREDISTMNFKIT